MMDTLVEIIKTYCAALDSLLMTCVLAAWCMESVWKWP